MIKYFIVSNKDDDYGNCKEELVKTTIENAKEYYSHKEVPEEDAKVLKKYMDFVDYDEEKERNSDRRFCGSNY